MADRKGPVLVIGATLADLPALRAEHPGLMRLETWLREIRWKS